MKLAGALIVAAICLPGCAIMPWPHMASATPRVRGTLNTDSKPVGAAALRVATGADGNPCAGKTAETSTNADGTFSVEPVREFRLLMVMMAHTFSPWSLCHKHGESWTVLVSGKEYSLVDTGPVGVQVAKCDLARSTDRRCQLTWEKE
jgi:hypothetical protein